MTISGHRFNAALVEWIYFLGFLFVFYIPPVSAKQTSKNSAEETAYAWRSLSIFYPVHQHELSGIPPFIAANTRSWPGQVSITEHGGALIWIEKFAIAKLSATRPKQSNHESEPLHLTAFRLQSDQLDPHQFSLSEEKLYRESDGTWRIYESQGKSGVWIIYANQESTLQAFTLAPQSSRFTWDDIEFQALRWIEGKIPFPDFVLPVETKADLEQHLQLDLQISNSLQQSIENNSPNAITLKKSILAWRTASAMQKILQLRPLERPSVAKVSLEKKLIPGRSITPIEKIRRSYQRVASSTNWSLSLKGPAVLALEIRPLLAEKELLRPYSQENVIQVESQGRLLFRKSITRQLARVRTSDGSSRSLPPRAPVSISTGEWLGQTEKIRIPIASHTHRYTIRLSGLPSLIKISHGIPVSRASAALRENTLAQQIQVASSNLNLASASEHNAATQHILESLIEELNGLPPRKKFESLPSLPLFLRIYVAYKIAINQEFSVRERHAWALRSMLLIENARSSVDLSILRSHTAQLLLELGDIRSAQQLLETQSNSPSHFPERPEMLSILTKPGDSNPNSTSRKLATMDALQKSSPLNQSIQTQRMRTWWNETRWRRVSPDQLTIDDSFTWIDTSKPYDQQKIGPPILRKQQTGRSRHEYWHLVRGKNLRVSIPSSKIDPHRKAIVELYSFPIDKKHHPFAVEVDGEKWLSSFNSRKRPIRLAIASGEHELRFRFSKTAEMFVRLPPRSVIDDRRQGYAAKKTRMWPLSLNEEPTVFALPPAGDPGLMRIDLKWIRNSVVENEQHSNPIQKPQILNFIVHSDIGVPRKFSASFANDNSNIVFPVSSDDIKTPQASRTVSVVMPIPPLAEKIWIESTDPSLVVAASLFVRSPKDRTTNLAAIDTPIFKAPSDRSNHSTTNLELLERLSQTIQSDPKNLPALFSRARLLLELNATRYAREDFFRIREQIDATKREYIPQFFDLLDFSKRRQEPRFVSTSKLERKANVYWLGPFTYEVFEKFPELDLYRTQIASALHLESSDQILEAALLWAKIFTETNHLEVGLACVDSFLRAWKSEKLEWHSRHADIAFGISSRVRELFDSDAVRRLQLLSSMTSKWKSISNVSSSGGKERIISPYRSNQDSPNEWIRNALAPAPWPAKEATLLRPGKASTIDIDSRTTRSARTIRSTRSIDLSIWCNRSRRHVSRKLPRSQQSVERHASLQLSHNSKRPQRIAIGHLQTIDKRLKLHQGINRISIGLEKTNAYWLCSVRFSQPPDKYRSSQSNDHRRRGEAILGHRTRDWFIAKPKRPVEFSILGPTTIELQSRTNINKPSLSVMVEAIAENDIAIQRSIDLSLSPDPHSKSTLLPSPPLTNATGTRLILPENKTYRVRIRPDQKHAWIYVRRRVPTSKPLTLPRRTSMALDLSQIVLATGDPPQQLQVPASVNGVEPETWSITNFGTISTQLRVGTQDIPDIDTQFHRRLAIADIAWRKGFRPQSLWLKLHPWVGFQQPMLLASGMNLTLLANRLPGGLRLTTSTSAATQGISGRQAWSLRSSLYLQRSFRLSTSWSIVPRLGFRYAFFPTHTRDVGVWYADWLHSEVYTQYRKDHPIALLSGWALRWQPWQAFRMSSKVTVIPNSDFLDLDRIDHNLDLRQLIDPYVRNPNHTFQYRIGYQTSLRLHDSHRDRSFLRHRLQAALTWNLWIHQGGRISLAFSDALYLVSGAKPFNVFLISLRHDATTDPLLRDFSPNETLFSTYQQRRGRTKAQ